MLSLIVIFAVLKTITASPACTSPLQNRSSFGIKGGDVAAIEDHPYEVIIEDDGCVICAGSIVSERYVLTTGYCLELMHKITSFIRAGSSHTGRDGSIHIVEQVIRSEEEPDKYLIGLIRVLEPFQFDRTRKAIPLFNQYEEIPPGSRGIVSGWGSTEPGDVNNNDQLYKLEMTILDDRICQNRYPSFRKGIMMCARNDEQKYKDICGGDLADPLVIDGRLAGLAFPLRFACDGTSPTVYTKIAHYRDWIDLHS